MASRYPSLGDGMVAGPLLQSLDLPAVAARLDAAGPIASMLSSGERALLVELARRTWQGAGAVIDAGTFLGSSLISSATGLEANPALPEVDLSRFPGGKPLHGYDLGVLPAPTSRWSDPTVVYGGQEVVRGESFVPILERNIAPHRQLIDLHIGDFNEQRWDGSPIEILFIDICKTAALNAHVGRQFLPAMIGGASTLIHQDFFFDRLPFIRVTMGYLKDYFRWEGQVDFSSVYSNVKAVPQDVAEHDPFLEAGLEECLAYHDAVAFPGIDRRYEFYLALSRCVLMSHKGGHDQAMEYLRSLAVEYADLLGDTADPAGSAFRMDRTIGSVVGALCRARRAAREPALAPVPSAGSPAPTDPLDPLDPARAALERGDWAAARRSLAPLVAQEPLGPAAVLLARTELESGDPGTAVGLLDEFLASRPRHKRARSLRARAHLALGDRAAARADVDRALATDPDFVAARRVLFEVEVADLRAQESLRTT